MRATDSKVAGGVVLLCVALWGPHGWAQTSQPGPAAAAPASRGAALSPTTSPKPPADAVEEVAEVREVKPSAAAAFWGEDYPRIDRSINFHYARTVRKRALMFIVDHRTTKPLTDNTWHDFFGFDAGALKIGLGLRYGILDSLDVGIYRLSSGADHFDVYELDLKYQLLHQERHFVDLGVRAGVTWFSQEGAQDAVGGWGQLLIDRLLWSRLMLGTGLLFHSDSSNEVKSSTDRNWSLAAQLQLDVRILGWLAWNAEMGINIAGYGTRGKQDSSGGAVGSYPSFASSVKFISNRHTFALVLTNNPYISADGLICNSPRGFKQLIVGFTITREWNL